jgi:hypothetical protein
LFHFLLFIIIIIKSQQQKEMRRRAAAAAWGAGVAPSPLRGQRWGAAQRLHTAAVGSVRCGHLTTAKANSLFAELTPHLPTQQHKIGTVGGHHCRSGQGALDTAS